MQYFVSNIRGNKKVFNTIIDKLDLRRGDTLWVLGNCIDSDIYPPEDSLEILDTIKNNQYINLLLGEHEMIHLLCFESRNNIDHYNAWLEYGEHLTISILPLLRHIENQGANEYYTFLMYECKSSNVIRLGQRYFYLSSGFPTAKFTENNNGKWQLLIATNLEVNENFFPIIKEDPYNKKALENAKEENTFVIYGRNPVDIFDFSNHIFSISGYYDFNDMYKVPILAMDSSGFFIKEVKVKKEGA